MKKKFTFLIAALMLLTMISQPTRLWGQTYKKVTSGPTGTATWDGEYIIVYETSGNGYVWTGVDANSNFVSASISSNTITKPNNAVSVTIASMTGGYSIRVNGGTNNGKYISGTSGSNTTNFNTNPVANTLTYSSGVDIESNTSHFVFNSTSNTTRYRYYKSPTYTGSAYKKPQLYRKAYTVTYDANGGSGSMTDTNSPYFENSTVTTKTNTFTNGTQSFTVWNTKANGSGESYAEGATFTITENTTLYAQWASATTVSTPSIYLDGGTYTGNQSTTISCGTDGASIYYTLDGTNPSSSNGTLYSGAITIDHSCTLKAIGIKDGLTDSEIASATYTIKVNTPSFTPTGGNLFQTTSVSITCETVGTSIYYTTDGTDPTSGSTLYSSAISVSSAQTIKAIAIKSGLTNSDVATATYTFPTVKTVAEARAYSGTDNFYTRGVVTYIVGDGKTAYIQDATAAIAIYKNDNTFTSGLSVGDDIVVNGKKTTYHGLVEVGTATIVTTLSIGNTVSPTVKTVTAINTDYGSGSGDNNFQSMFVKIEKATYNGSNSVTQSGSSITVEGTMGDAVNGDAVTFTGIIGCYDGVKIINLGNVEIVNDPTILASASLTVPSYVQGTPAANITAGSLSVSGSHLTADITCTLDENSKFELYNGSTWTNTTTIAQTTGSASGSLQIRLKANQSYNANAYTGSVTLSSTGVENVVVSLSGSVTYAHVTYSGNADGVTNVPTDATNYTYNQQVTVLGKGSMDRTGYDFVKWNTESDGTGQDYVEDGTFNITEDVTLYAQWTAKSYNITADPAITHGSISFTVGGAAATTAQTGQTVTIVSTPDSGYGLNSVSVNSGAITVTNNTFVMPASDVTVSATFVVMVTDVLTLATTGISSGAGYDDWSGKTSNSDAVYAGRSAGGNNSIQLRDKNNTNTPGIVTTSTGGKVKKVSVSWNSNTTSGRYITVYGKTSAYSGYSDLYSNTSSTVGEQLGTIVYGTSTELIVTGDYSFIGIKASEPLYLDQINITWDPIKYTVTYDAHGGSGSMTDPNSPYTSNQTVTVLSNSFTGPVVSEVTQEFARWNTKADGSGTNYNPGATFSMPKANVTLYAQWIAPCTLAATMDDAVLTASYVAGENRIKLDMLSDVYALGGCDITDYGFVYSTSVSTPTIGADNCEKIVVGTEYGDAGDYIEYSLASATLGATYYVRSYAINNAGTAYSDPVSVTIASSYPTYTINYSTNGNSEGSSTINQGNAIGTLPTPTESYIPDGYEFVGWYNGESYSSETAPTVVKATDVPANNMNLKAMFAISPSGGEQYLEITIDNFSEITTSYTTTFTHTYPEATITAYGVYKNSNGIQMNSGKGTYIKNTTAMPGAITKFELTWTSTGNNSPTMYANTNSVASTSSTSLGKQSNTVTTQTINTTVSDGYRYFYFDGTVTGACYLSSFKIYYIDLYYTTSATVPSGDYWHVNGSGVLTDNTTIPAGSYTLTSTITVPNGKTLTVNGYLGTSAENLIIEDGGQLVTSNAVAATVKKSTTASEAKTSNAWYLISSPVNNAVITGVNGFAQGTYNVYRYNETTMMWENDIVYIDPEHPESGTTAAFSKLTNGRGYLYRSTVAGIVFAGDVNVESVTFNSSDEDHPLTYTEESGNLKGFNLLGNPFTHDITWSNLTTTTNIADAGYYLLGTNGEWASQTNAGTIAPMQGFLVQATAASPVVTISNTAAKGENANHDNIMFKVENSEYSDVTYAMFDKGYGLSKINHRNQNVPMLYIPQDGADYAIAMMDDNTNSFNLNFEAKTAGRYTLSFKANGKFNYLHVIDRMTGEDVDMLLEGEYSFIGSPMDNANRFIVRLGYLPNYDDNGEDIFAYQNGNDIVVSGEGELQIFDVMGRMVSAQRVNGVETINLNAKGVYVFKLNEKTQKIVVK